MTNPETPVTPQERAKELVEHFQKPRPGIACQTIQDDLRDALEGACAEEIFGDQRVPLLERVQRMSDADLMDANATVHLFSTALLLRLEEFTSHSLEDLTQSLKGAAAAEA